MVGVWHGRHGLVVLAVVDVVDVGPLRGETPQLVRMPGRETTPARGGEFVTAPLSGLHPGAGRGDTGLYLLLHVGRRLGHDDPAARDAISSAVSSAVGSGSPGPRTCQKSG